MGRTRTVPGRLLRVASPARATEAVQAVTRPATAVDSEMRVTGRGALHGHG